MKLFLAVGIAALAVRFGRAQGIGNAAGSQREHQLREETKKLQIQNFKDGTALLLNIHITHHGGTYLCGVLKKEGGLIAPDFACMGGENWNAANMTRFEKDRFSYRNTAVDVSAIRRQFQFDSWEYSLPKSPYFNVDWDYENLVSVIPMRHPLDRFLLGASAANFIRPYTPTQTQRTKGSIGNTRIVSVRTTTRCAFWVQKMGLANAVALQCQMNVSSLPRSLSVASRLSSISLA